MAIRPTWTFHDMLSCWQKSCIVKPGSWYIFSEPLVCLHSEQLYAVKPWRSTSYSLQPPRNWLTIIFYMNAYCKLGSAAICNDIAIQACQRRRGGGTYSGLGGERVDHGSRHRRAELADGSAPGRRAGRSREPPPQGGAGRRVGDGWQGGGRCPGGGILSNKWAERGRRRAKRRAWRLTGTKTKRVIPTHPGPAIFEPLRNKILKHYNSASAQETRHTRLQAWNKRCKKNLVRANVSKAISRCS
jgi:hypothetical protein